MDDLTSSYSPSAPPSGWIEIEIDPKSCHFCGQALSLAEQQTRAEDSGHFPTCHDCDSDPAPVETDFMRQLLAVRGVVTCVLVVSFLGALLVVAFSAFNR